MTAIRLIRDVLMRALALTTLAALALSAQAGIVTLKYNCSNCGSQKLVPSPTNIHFDESTQLFEQFTVSWNSVDFDFTFPNAQPAFVREWFWDALNGLAVTSTADPGSGTPEVFPIRRFADAYSVDSPVCFSFFIGSSGAGPRCELPPFPDQTIFPANVQGVSESARNIPEPGTLALAGIALCGALAARRSKRAISKAT